jgi:hypothetical protein
MKSLHIFFFIALFLFHLPANAQRMDTKSKIFLEKLNEINGNYESLIALNDVQFTYTKVIHGNTRVSNEQLIFKGEHSLSTYNGEYKQQQGIVKRSSVNSKGAMSIDDKILTAEKSKKVAVYANSITFYWFTMMYKLSDPSTVSTYIGQETIDEMVYDKVKLVFDYSKLNKKSHDEYLLYFNPDTHLVDVFMYSETNGDVIKNPKAKVFVTYKVTQGIHVPAIRKHFKLNEKGEWGIYGVFTFSGVTFDNGFELEDFKL